MGFLSVGASCEKSPQPELEGVRHPQDEFLHRPVEVASRIDLSTPPDEGNPFYSILTNARLVVELGSLDGNEEEVFGRIADVVVDSRNRVYVLDSFNHRIRVFSKEGLFIGEAGAAGQGPGEFAQEVAMTLDGRGRLYVADLGRIHAFSVTDSAPVFDRVLRSLEPVDLCTLSGTVIEHGVGLESTGILRKMSDEGEFGDWFGDVYDAPTPFLGFHIRRSRIACLGELGIVAMAPKAILGEVHAYGLDGTPRWISVIDGFTPAHLEVTPRGGVAVTFPETGFDRITSIVNIPGGHLLIQISNLSQEDRLAHEQYTELSSFIIDAQDGQLVPIGAALPPIIAFGDGYFVSHTQNPFPKIGIHEFRD